MPSSIVRTPVTKRVPLFTHASPHHPLHSNSSRFTSFYSESHPLQSPLRHLPLISSASRVLSFSRQFSSKFHLPTLILYYFFTLAFLQSYLSLIVLALFLPSSSSGAIRSPRAPHSTSSYSPFYPLQSPLRHLPSISSSPCHHRSSAPPSQRVPCLPMLLRTIHYIQILPTLHHLTLRRTPYNPPKTPPFHLFFSVSPSIVRTPVARRVLLSTQASPHCPPCNRPHPLHHLTLRRTLYHRSLLHRVAIDHQLALTSIS